MLDKPGKLDADEWASVRLHAQYTDAVLSRIGAFGELARGAAAPHERLEGQGYPRGLAGVHIPIGTRTITSADSFDAISATRPCRDAVPIDRTLEIMAATVGSAIDPVCFDALRQVLTRGTSEADAPLA